MSIATLTAVAQEDQRRRDEFEQYAADAGVFAFIGMGFEPVVVLPRVVAAIGRGFTSAIEAVIGR